MATAVTELKMFSTSKIDFRKCQQTFFVTKILSGAFDRKSHQSTFRADKKGLKEEEKSILDNFDFLFIQHSLEDELSATM